MPHTVFILSPASTGGRRAQLLLSSTAKFPLAERTRRDGAPLGEVFSFLSGLYFRGKLAYASRFGSAPHGSSSALVITSNAGLLPADTRINPETLRHFAQVFIDPSEPRYVRPLRESTRELCGLLQPDSRVVLLGSIASDKYVSVLSEALDRALLFPTDFIGRGDMSRGGLLLRAVDEGTELEYEPLDPAVRRRGKRPPKLGPRKAAAPPE